MTVTLHEGHYWRLKYLTQKLQNLQMALAQIEADGAAVSAERRQWIERAGLDPFRSYTLDDETLTATCEDPPEPPAPPDLAPQVTKQEEA